MHPSRRDSRDVRAVSAQRVLSIEQFDVLIDRPQKQLVQRGKLLGLVVDDIHHDVTPRPEQCLFADDHRVDGDRLLTFESRLERASKVIDSRVRTEVAEDRDVQGPVLSAEAVADVE